MDFNQVLENVVDTFQRKLLRNVLGIYWPKVISNESLYQKTNQQPWSLTIRKRRLTWFGHLMRLSPDTPAQVALNLYLQKVKKPQGGVKQTWLGNIYKDIKENSNLDIDFKDEQTIT